MQQFRNTGSSKSRAKLMRSPNSHQIQDSSKIKLKYQKLQNQLKQQKKRNFVLQNSKKQLEENLAKKQKKLTNKQQMNDILLDKIDELKRTLNTITKNSIIDTSNQQNRSASGKISWENSKVTNQIKSTGHCSSEYNQSGSFNTQNSQGKISAGKVGGYFGSLFK